MKPLALALMMFIPTTANDVFNTVADAIDESGVKMGAYYGCFTNEINELECILPEKEQNVRENEQNVRKPSDFGLKKLKNKWPKADEN